MTVTATTLKIGVLHIHWYGVILTVAIIAGLAVALAMARLHRQGADPLAGILLLGVLAGTIGARVWYVAFERHFYEPDPGRVFAVWEGGMALHGALLGGILATLIYTWSKELDFWTWADICAPGLILGQGIGRIGDLVNHQAFGLPTTGGWYVEIPVENRPPQYQAFSHFTPTAAYEGLWDAAVFIILLGITLLVLRRVPGFPRGTVFLSYLVLYSAGRIPLEGLRVDSLYLGSLRAAQVASWACIGIGLLFFIIRNLPRHEELPDEVPLTYVQTTDAYFLAATRGMQSRPPAGDAEIAQGATWNGQPVIQSDYVGNGHMAPMAELPEYQGPTLQLPTYVTRPESKAGEEVS